MKFHTTVDVVWTSVNRSLLLNHTELFVRPLAPLTNGFPRDKMKVIAPVHAHLSELDRDKLERGAGTDLTVVEWRRFALWIRDCRD